MDPWTPQTSVKSLSPPPSDPRQELISSERYLASLETKLNRLQNRSLKELTSKDVLDGLTQAKDAHMKTLTDTSSSPYISNHGDEAEEIEASSASAVLHRRLCPEKQALNTEELQVLVENDQLQKLILSIGEECEETDIDRKEEENR